VLFAALQGAATVVVSGEEEVTALAVSPAGDELLVGLADGSVNAHALPSGAAHLLISPSSIRPARMKA
jgi:hypothetical protein